MNFVLLYGPPGVGKLTVAKELAGLTGFKLFDNHASFDVVRRLIDMDAEPFWPLVHRFCLDLFETAAQLNIDFITTGAYIYPDDNEIMEHRFSVIEKHKGRVVLVHLTCDSGVLDERVQSESRWNKLQQVEAARADRAEKDYFTPIPNRESLLIDNTDLSPVVVARQIVEHYSLPVA